MKIDYTKMINNKKIVIKFGGSLLDNKDIREEFWKDIKALSDKNKIIIVHGGGKEISKYLEILHLDIKFINGKRYTDKKIMEIVEMVLSGKINKMLTSELSKLNIDALGLSGRDGNLIIAEKNEILGEVGTPKILNLNFLKKLLDKNIIPIISPVSNDKSGDPLNINADETSSFIAENIKADNLIFMTDAPGVMLDKNDKNSVINILDKKMAQDLINKKIITDGMIPKIQESFSSIDNGVKEVNIIDGNISGILNKFFNNNSIGTRIKNEI